MSMSMPDLTPLDESQLRAVLDTAAARLAQVQGQDRAARDVLLDESAVRVQIESLKAQIVALDEVLATPVKTVRDDPAPHIMAVARATRRVANNTIRVLRTSAGVLDSTDLGSEK